MTVDLSRYDNTWYNPGPLFRRVAWYLASMLFFRHAMFPFYGIKTAILRLFGAHVGEGVVVKPSVHIKYPWFLALGDHCWVGEKVWIDNLAQVNIGAHACLSQGAFILTGNHDYSSKTFGLIVKPVNIEQGAWIGAFAVVCPGVTVSSHAVLTVKSVATSNLDAYGVYQGNPAAWIKERKIN